VNDYEILLMLDPDVPEERHEEILARVRELVERGGGRWDGQDAWGRRKLAYEIAKRTEGVYHLLTFACAPETLDEVTRVLKITDGVLRHMATRRAKPHRRPARAAAGRPAETAEYAAETQAETEGGR
jgi:small subunit ribosomal protein S6